MDDVFDRILATIRTFCDFARPPEWLTNDTLDANAHRGTGQAAQLLGELRDGFTKSELDAAGVLQPRGRGTALRTDFASTEREFVVLRDAAGCAFDVVTATGCLRHKGPALLVMLRDAAFQAALRDTKIVFVAFSIGDLIALRSLRLPAVLATGLDRVGADDQPMLQQLFEITWLEGDDEEEETDDPEPVSTSPSTVAAESAKGKAAGAAAACTASVPESHKKHQPIDEASRLDPCTDCLSVIYVATDATLLSGGRLTVDGLRSADKITAGGDVAKAAAVIPTAAEIGVVVPRDDQSAAARAAAVAGGLNAVAACGPGQGGQGQHCPGVKLGPPETASGNAHVPVAGRPASGTPIAEFPTAAATPGKGPRPESRKLDQPQRTAAVTDGSADSSKDNWLNSAPATNEFLPGELAIDPSEIDRIILVGWSPARADTNEPPGYEATAGHLRGLHVHLELSLAKVGIWRPQPEQVEALLFSARYGRPEDVRKKILRSFEYTVQGLGPWRAPPSLAELVRNFLRLTTLGGRTEPGIDDAGRHLLAKLREEVIAPLLTLDARAGEDLQSIDRVCAALAGWEALQKLVHRHIYLARTFRMKYPRDPTYADQAAEQLEDAQELKAILEMLKPLHTLAKEPSKCPPKFRQARRRWQIRGQR